MSSTTGQDAVTADRGLPLETDVCIVGAGPVGSALALELRLRGVSCVVVEKTQTSICKLVSYEGDVSGLKSLEEAIKRVVDE